MKLWYSFTKELKLASMSFYFYIEVFMALFFLALLLLVIPEEFDSKTTEYIYLDMPSVERQVMMDAIVASDLDGVSEAVTIKASGEKISTQYFETEDRKIYMTETEADMIQLAKSEKHLGAKIYMDDEGVKYDYYLQGYESDKLKTLYKVIHNKDAASLAAEFEGQEIVLLGDQDASLTDRENILPAFLTLNGALMGMFIVAAYVFLDKKEGIVTAYAVTASKVWVYLMSKVGVLIVTTILTTLLIVVPIMGLQPNYLMMVLFLTVAAFFASSLGLLIASFFDNITQAFGVVYVLMIGMMLPAFAYFLPGWNPLWIEFIPSYYMLFSFKELILDHGDMAYVLTNTLGFLGLGGVLFLYANYRYKKTLTVSA